MNSDVEEVLRESISRLTASARGPAGPAWRAHQRYRRRRLAARAAIAVGLAALIAVTAMVAARSGSSRPVGRPASILSARPATTADHASPLPPASVLPSQAR